MAVDMKSTATMLQYTLSMQKLVLSHAFLWPRQSGFAAHLGQNVCCPMSHSNGRHLLESWKCSIRTGIVIYDSVPTQPFRQIVPSLWSASVASLRIPTSLLGFMAADRDVENLRWDMSMAGVGITVLACCLLGAIF